MTRAKVGLLGLYLELYDRVLPAERERIDSFYTTIERALGEEGLEVVSAPTCRLRAEFDAAVKSFQDAGADAVVTLHLAYSPSLEAADALAATDLPVIVLDTTPAYSYAPSQDPAELMYNHGIHGVQDLCNILIRKGKPFHIEAGHWQKSDVLKRVAAWARVARMASAMRSARVGILGSPFKGMGDFQVPQDVLRREIGMTVVPADFAELRKLVPPADDASVLAELAADAARFDLGGLDEGFHNATVRASLAVRRWMEQEGLTAFTMNFEDVDRSTGLPTAPFLEASKAIARGQGYAGEGDVLTAAFVGVLSSSLGETSFTEMFCADWEGDTVYLSHMAELNPDVVVGKARLVVKQMAWVDAEPPVVTIGRFKAGPAVFANLAPGPEDSFTLILCPVQMLEDRGDDVMQDAIRGWFRPPLTVPRFLEAYSRAGGTHHAALVYGDRLQDLRRFGRMMGWNELVVE